MNVFLSYRRDDSHYIADRIYDWLIQERGRRNVFKDVDSIPLGRDFRQVIHDAVHRCDVLLVVIGPGWVTVAKAPGMRRLDDPLDFVRMEIEAALERDIPIIPLLVNNTTMPTAEDLPSSLHPLAYRNGLLVRPDPDFHHDMGRLIAILSKTRFPLPRRRVITSLLGAVVAALATLILLLAIPAMTSRWSGKPRDAEYTTAVITPGPGRMITEAPTETKEVCPPTERAITPGPGRMTTEAPTETKEVRPPTERAITPGPGRMTTEAPAEKEGVRPSMDLKRLLRKLEQMDLMLKQKQMELELERAKEAPAEKEDVRPPENFKPFG